jgi:predicted thioesterase
MTLRPGLEREQAFVAEGRLLTDVGGTLGLKVLSTPSMIGMMEQTAARLAAAQLDGARATVGFEVCVRHVAGAPEGTACIARAVLRDVVDERKLRYDVEVRAADDGRVIGIGTHERRIVPVAAHAEGLRGR